MLKVIVVGGGIVGLSTAWALRRHGAEVTVVEQGPLPNPLGSSVDQHRLIRYAYGAQAGYTRMVREAFHAWERSEEHTSELQSLMRISYAVFCLKKKKTQHLTQTNIPTSI